jgi:hypothetical protein
MAMTYDPTQPWDSKFNKPPIHTMYYHAECAPQPLCKPAHITVLTNAVVDEATLARWNEATR